MHIQVYFLKSYFGIENLFLTKNKEKVFIWHKEKG